MLEWTALTGSLRPEPREESGLTTRSRAHFRAEHILPHLTPTRRAMLRSQSGPVAGIWNQHSSGSCFSCASPCRCPCPNAAVGVAVSLTPLATTMQLDLGNFGQEVLFRECGCKGLGAGGRVATNFLVRDLDLRLPNVHDKWLSTTSSGVQLAVSVVQGQPQRGASNGRYRFQSCLEKEGDRIPQPCGSKQSSTLGGFGLGSWRQLVSRNQHRCTILLSQRKRDKKSGMGRGEKKHEIQAPHWGSALQGHETRARPTQAQSHFGVLLKPIPLRPVLLGPILFSTCPTQAEPVLALSLVGLALAGLAWPGPKLDWLETKIQKSIG